MTARADAPQLYELKPVSMGMRIDVTNIGDVLDLLDQVEADEPAP